MEEEIQKGAIGPNVKKRYSCTAQFPYKLKITMNRDLAKDKTSIHLWLLSSCLDSAQLLDPPQLQMA